MYLISPPKTTSKEIWSFSFLDETLPETAIVPPSRYDNLSVEISISCESGTSSVILIDLLFPFPIPMELIAEIL